MERKGMWRYCHRQWTKEAIRTYIYCNEYIHHPDHEPAAVGGRYRSGDWILYRKAGFRAGVPVRRFLCRYRKRRLLGTFEAGRIAPAKSKGRPRLGFFG